MVGEVSICPFLKHISVSDAHPTYEMVMTAYGDTVMAMLRHGHVFGTGHDIILSCQ